MASTTSDDTALEKVKAFWERQRPVSAIYNVLFSDLVFVSATHGSILASFPLKPIHLNSKGTLHGSVSATLMDWAGGMALASTGMPSTGVSVDIHVSYLGTAKEGDTVFVSGTATKEKGTLLFTEIKIMKDAPDGRLIASGTHTKFRT